MNRNEMIDRYNEIENMVREMEKPVLGITSAEDVDDLYQSRLEYDWWRDEIQDEWDRLSKELGIDRILTFN